MISSAVAREALVKRDGAFKRIPVRELVRGDIIKLKIGDVVPGMHTNALPIWLHALAWFVIDNAVKIGAYRLLRGRLAAADAA